MSRAGRYWKVWPVLLVVAGLIVWLAHAALERAEISEVAYASGLAAQQPDDARPVVIERPPVRVIKDPYPAFSAVAVDSDSNMVVITDQNLFQILEYDSRANTPPQAAFTEPRRIISGTATHAEMMCGVYIDPKTREIYVTNNDTQDWMPVFDLKARGNAKPSRLLATPHGAFGLAVHEQRQEVFITVQHQNAVYVFPKYASGNDSPLRVLQGGDTQLEDPHGIALDTKNNLMFVSNFGNAQVTAPESAVPATEGRGGGRVSYGKFEPPSITVYPLEAKGNIRPLRIIEGPKTLLNWPAHVALHEERQELFLANDADNSIVVFRATDRGDVSPIRVTIRSQDGNQESPGHHLGCEKGRALCDQHGDTLHVGFPLDGQWRRAASTNDPSGTCRLERADDWQPWSGRV